MSSNVTLTIAGRRYTIACAAGEEAHIEALGRSIDDKLAALDSLAGNSPERILLYASLLLADELHEAKNAAPAAPRADHAETLENLADRLEALASQLESAAATA